eukprot:Phypoly_transcript_00912.p1 GENE.Phypoly_transcript_00912~~Phypoly_transcript_00912.p1  ORF type:complete len:687 (+),score=153.17 Phypoly_transcript_00912:96-2063(+)
MEADALGTAPPQRDDWAHKQLMGMINRSADGQRVVGEEDNFGETPSLIRTSAFSNAGKAKSMIVSSLESSPLGQSQPLAPMQPCVTQPRTLLSSSSTSALPIGNLRREAKSSIFENRLRVKREKDQHMARMIMEEEHKKAKDREKLREAEERMKAKAFREQQAQRLQPYHEQGHDKQQSSSPQNPTDDNFAYFRQMRKKIKDINVKPTLPSIGLDEKLKKLNTRVKGFLTTTNPPSFSLPIQKFRDKRNSKQMGKNMPIKLNVVDDYLQDLELQRMGDESSMDSRDGLSPIMPRAGYDIHSSANSSPSDAQQKQIKRSRKRLTELRLANKSTSELQFLVRALNQDLQANTDAIVAAQKTCAKIRAEMEKSKDIFTVQIDETSNKILRASERGAQFITTVKDIRSQLDKSRTATSSCSDQIKQLEVHVQKVQRAKKPTDKLLRYLFWIPISILLLYLVFKSPTVQMLVVLSVFVMVIRTVRDQNASDSPQLPNFQEVAPVQYDITDDEPEDLSDSSEIQPPETPADPSSPAFPKKPDTAGAATSSMRRNHSDLVLQSLEDEFHDALQDPPILRTVQEDDTMGISPKTKSKSSSFLASKPDFQEPAKIGSSGSRSGTTLRGGPLRTSANNKDSLAMNLALHNLNQMSLKIQQMQQGK